MPVRVAEISRSCPRRGDDPGDEEPAATTATAQRASAQPIESRRFSVRRDWEVLAVVLGGEAGMLTFLC